MTLMLGKETQKVTNLLMWTVNHMDGYHKSYCLGSKWTENNRSGYYRLIGSRIKVNGE